MFKRDSKTCRSPGDQIVWKNKDGNSKGIDGVAGQNSKNVPSFLDTLSFIHTSPFYVQIGTSIQDDRKGNKRFHKNGEILISMMKLCYTKEKETDGKRNEMEEIRKLQEMIDKSSNIVFFGGAGVSTESNIPDFRSEDGLYHLKYDVPPETIHQPHLFSETSGGILPVL